MDARTRERRVRAARKGAGYRSRAAYKLLEIAARDKLLKPGLVVVDLGAAPGGWSQVAQAQVGARGLVIALDVLKMTPLPGVKFLQGDFREVAVLDAIEEALHGRRVILFCDMSPNISGISMSDQRAMHLRAGAGISGRQLKPGGNLLVKVFQALDLKRFFA